MSVPPLFTFVLSVVLDRGGEKEGMQNDHMDDRNGFNWPFQPSQVPAITAVAHYFTDRI